MYYNQEIINEILRKVSLRDLIEEYTKLTYIGGRLIYGNCPFHNETGNSFSVDIKTQTFYCFGCGIGGNAIDFMMKIKKVSFVEAVTELANKVGVILPEPSIINLEDTQQKKQRITRMNLIAANLYSYQLRKYNDGLLNPGMEYFRNRRLDSKTIYQFKLGYAGGFGNKLYHKLLENGFSKNEILESGLVGCKTEYANSKCYDKFWNRVIFPILNENNQCIGFGGRCLDDSKPKYLNSPETIVFNKGNNLYGLNIAKNNAQNGIILTEGYMDTIALHQAGFNNAIASLGTALTLNQANLIKKYSNTVFLAYDSDEAGIKAATRAIPILSNAGIEAKIIKMPGAKDPDEYIQKYGRKKFQKRIEEAESSSRFLVQNSDNKYDQAINILLNLQ